MFEESIAVLDASGSLFMEWSRVTYCAPGDSGLQSVEETPGLKGSRVLVVLSPQNPWFYVITGTLTAFVAEETAGHHN